MNIYKKVIHSIFKYFKKRDPKIVVLKLNEAMVLPRETIKFLTSKLQPKMIKRKSLEVGFRHQQFKKLPRILKCKVGNCCSKRREYVHKYRIVIVKYIRIVGSQSRLCVCLCVYAYICIYTDCQKFKTAF